MRKAQSIPRKALLVTGAIAGALIGAHGQGNPGEAILGGAIGAGTGAALGHLRHRQAQWVPNRTPMPQYGDPPAVSGGKPSFFWSMFWIAFVFATILVVGTWIAFATSTNPTDKEEVYEDLLPDAS